ncbi:hypothetical protein ES708_28770 [subsurface metagenome]
MNIFYSEEAILTSNISQPNGNEYIGLELLIFGVFVVVVVSLAIWRPTWLKHLRDAIATVGVGSGKGLLALGKGCAAFIVKVLGHLKRS